MGYFITFTFLCLVSLCQSWCSRQSYFRSGKPRSSEFYTADTTATVSSSSYSTPATCMHMQDADFLPAELPSVPLVVISAGFLLVAAQTLINRQLEGERGLGAYLKDGSGYSKSGFRPLGGLNEYDRAVSSDPLPWLKLPKLDFVQVAGQKDSAGEDQEIASELETLRLRMNELLEQDRVDEATLVRRQLEELLRESGMEYNKLE